VNLENLLNLIFQNSNFFDVLYHYVLSTKLVLYFLTKLSMEKF